MIFFTLTIIFLMFFLGVLFIAEALRHKKELYYPKAACIMEFANGIAHIAWAIGLIILEFI